MSASSSRRYAKRSTRRLYQNIDKSLNRIQVLREMFDDDRHPEHVELLTLIATLQIQVQEFVVEFYRHSWGQEPEDWYADVGN